MLNRNNRKPNIVLRLAAVLLLLVVVTVCAMPNGFVAKYVVSASGNDDARVASFNFTADKASGQTALDLSALTYPGTQATFTFTVTNGSGSSVSEVSQRVIAKLTQTGDLPLKFTVQEQGASDTPTQMGIGSSAQLAEFVGGSAASKTYVLTVIWPESENDISHVGKKSTVTLSVTAEQID